MVEEARFAPQAEQLAAVGRSFYARGWALGTSGNFSSVLSLEPFRLAITASSLDKSELSAEGILEIGAGAQVIAGVGKPSSEALLHLTIVLARGAGAVLHTHSVWNHIVSDVSGEGIAIGGYEMLKGLDGITTHEHCEWLPILDNCQDMPALSQTVDRVLADHPQAHGFLLRRHGLYTWGRDLAEAKRHTEIFEFLLEVIGRTAVHK
jgi:methylthioribulose-1-phosphate dehydratase